MKETLSKLKKILKEKISNCNLNFSSYCIEEYDTPIISNVSLISDDENKQLENGIIQPVGEYDNDINHIISHIQKPSITLATLAHLKAHINQLRKKADSQFSKEDISNFTNVIDDIYGQNNFAEKNEGGLIYPSKAYAYVPDVSKPSTWKLRIWETPEKKITSRQVGLAISAIGKGFRGQKVQIPVSDRPAVLKKIKSAWMKANPDKSHDEMPDILNNKTFADSEIQKEKPAFGWLKNLRRKGEILYTDIVGIPAKLYKIIKNGGFKDVSIEMFPDWKGHGASLTALSLLGQTKPAIDNLNSFYNLYNDDELKTLSDTYSIKNVPICKVGVWNDIVFTKDIIDEMVKNQKLFSKPVKIGHQENQNYEENIISKKYITLGEGFNVLKNIYNKIDYNLDKKEESMEFDEVKKEFSSNPDFAIKLSEMVIAKIKTEEGYKKMKENAEKFDGIKFEENLPEIKKLLGISQENITLAEIRDTISSNFKTIQNELGIPEDCKSFSELIEKLKSEKIDSIIANAIKENKFSESQKEIYRSGLLNNFEVTKKIIDSLDKKNFSEKTTGQHKENKNIDEVKLQEKVINHIKNTPILKTWMSESGLEEKEYVKVWIKANPQEIKNL